MRKDRRVQAELTDNGSGGVVTPGGRPVPPEHGSPDAPGGRDNAVDASAEPSWVRPSVSSAGSGGRSHTDELFRERYPTLHDWLTYTGLGGLAREPGKIGITALKDRWKITLTDSDEGAWSCYITDETLLEALKAVDDGLKRGWLQWQPSTYKSSTKKRKRRVADDDDD